MFHLWASQHFSLSVIGSNLLHTCSMATKAAVSSPSTDLGSCRRNILIIPTRTRPLAGVWIELCRLQRETEIVCGKILSRQKRKARVCVKCCKVSMDNLYLTCYLSRSHDNRHPPWWISNFWSMHSDPLPVMNAICGVTISDQTSNTLIWLEESLMCFCISTNRCKANHGWLTDYKPTCMATKLLGLQTDGETGRAQWGF